LALEAHMLVERRCSMKPTRAGVDRLAAKPCRYLGWSPGQLAARLHRRLAHAVVPERGDARDEGEGLSAAGRVARRGVL